MHIKIKTAVIDLYLRQSSCSYHNLVNYFSESRLDSTPEILNVTIKISNLFKEDYNREFYLYKKFLYLYRSSRVFPDNYSIHEFNIP